MFCPQYPFLRHAACSIFLEQKVPFLWLQVIAIYSDIGQIKFDNSV